MAETSYAQLKKFGDAVRAARMELGLSQEDFAERCAVHRTYMGAVERAEVNVSFANIAAIARALGVKVSELFAKAKL